MNKILSIALLLCLMATSTQAQTTLQLSSTDFGITSVKNEIEFFRFSIELSDTLTAGQSYNDPSISQIDYRVDGDLRPMGSPSGFPSFILTRDYTGADFYSQSPDATLQFAIDASADLSDGLQLSELTGTGTDTTFLFNAREFEQAPARYHPPRLTLLADGTGELLNSNNNGGSLNNPSSGVPVDVDFGEEYNVALSFTPSTTTVTGPIAAVPEPTSLALLGFGSIAMLLRRRR